MRKFIYVIFGLMIFLGAAGLLYTRQMQVVEGDAPAVSQAEPSSTTRGLTPDRRVSQRRYDRGLDQYKTQDGGWKIFEAAIDILNIVVGIIGIGLALSGMRARREGNVQRQS